MFKVFCCGEKSGLYLNIFKDWFIVFNVYDNVDGIWMWLIDVYRWDYRYVNGMNDNFYGIIVVNDNFYGIIVVNRCL